MGKGQADACETGRFSGLLLFPETVFLAAGKVINALRIWLENLRTTKKQGHAKIWNILQLHVSASHCVRTRAFFVMFIGCEREHQRLLANNGTSKFENILVDPFESFMIMFIMSVGEFALFYNTLNDCRSSLVPLGKVMFLIYELLVTVMLLNLLIAMMTRTYEKISETQKEWKRQWAQVILLLEQSLRPHDRLIAMLKYSSPIRSDKAHRSFVVRQRVQASISPTFLSPPIPPFIPSPASCSVHLTPSDRLGDLSRNTVLGKTLAANGTEGAKNSDLKTFL
uniref:Ion transport domain-containing protein n=1 Tax=Parascaris equorum TaxID=6256 RepID=A0A914S0G2_PAREQ